MATTKYILTESTGNATRLIKFLDTNEYAELEANQTIIKKIRYFLWRIKEIELNYDSLLNSIEKYENQYRTENFKISSFELCVIDLNRLFTNLVCSFKYFIDHFETKVRKEKHESIYTNIFLPFKTLQYDNNISYKLFYNLRNFSQHYFYPLSYIKIVTDYQTTERSLNIGFIKSSLLEDKTLKKKIGNALDSYNEVIPLKPLLLMFAEITNDLELLIYKIYEFEIENCYRIIEQYSQFNSTKESSLGFGFSGPDKEIFNTKTKIIDFELVYKLNNTLQNFKMRTFSNQAVNRKPNVVSKQG